MKILLKSFVILSIFFFIRNSQCEIVCPYEPTGFVCASAGSKKKCRVGAYYKPKNKECCICPAGCYCPSTTTLTDKYECPSNHYCEGNSGIYNSCPSEYPYSGSGSKSITDCYKKIPDYSENITHNYTEYNLSSNYKTGIIKYTNCKQKYNESTKTCDKQTICDKGNHYTSNTCHICPGGHYCINNTQYNCPAGSYCYRGASSATKCPAGYTSEANWYTCKKYNVSIGCSISNGTGTQTCTHLNATNKYENCSSCTISSCNLGYYKNGNSCEACPKGHKCSNGIKTECSAGSYQPSAGKSICLTCPAGSYCPQGSSNPLPCILGGTSASGSGSITDCFKTNAAFNNSKGTGIYSGQCQYKE